ncbi:MAG: AMP-binding protein, partial [bacterium]|nr:AMP-binding protein [bacterium]
YINVIDEIPLTPNRKIDRKALSQLKNAQLETPHKYTPPRNEKEKQLAMIWAGILGIEKENTVGIDDNFFRLGGHSLKATMLTALIQKELEIEIPLSEIFKHPTIREMTAYLHGADKKTAIPIERAGERDYYPLSSAQMRIYLLYRMAPESLNYNMPMVIETGNKLEKKKVETVTRQLIARHESLRTSFFMKDGTPVQKIHAIEETAWEVENFGKVKGTQIEAELKEKVRPFDLSRPPLFRVGIAGRVTGEGMLLWDMHHIVSDGISVEILEREFHALYRGEEQPDLGMRYRDFAVWQRDSENTAAIGKQEAYWLERLDGLPGTELPMDYPRPEIQTFEGAGLYFFLGESETAALNEKAADNNVTMFMIFAALYNILLSRLSGAEDIIVGTPASGRRQAELMQIVGMFVNTLALRNYPGADKTFLTFLAELKEDTLAAFENQDYQFETLVEALGVPGNINRNPVFDAFFTMQNIETKHEAGDESANDGELIYLDDTVSKFDIGLNCVNGGRRLKVGFEYCRKLFKQETIERFAGYFKRILTAVLPDPKTGESPIWNRKKPIKLADIEILPVEEKHLLLYEFNETGSRYPTDKTIHQLFETRVQKAPDTTSIVGNNHRRPTMQLTYRQLNEEAQHLAVLLQKQGVAANSLVGILADRTVEMIIGILAILKTGCGYVPLNPKAPAERNKYMLDECAVPLLLTASTLTDAVKAIAPQRNIINIEAGRTQLVSDREKKSDEGTNPQYPITNNSLSIAYVIFTSGSTGQPKGVPITHSNFSPLVHWGYRELGIGSDDRALQNLSYYFDWSVWEIFITLTTGASLYMIPDELQMDPKACIQFTQKNKITVLHATPTQWQYLLPVPVGAAGSAGSDTTKNQLKSLRYLCIGAEKLPLHLAERSIGAVAEECRVFNMYGPTEATIISAVLEINKKNLKNYKYLSSVPIGKPAGNSLLYVLDKNLKPVPLKVEGELYIGGESIAQGYLNNQELTKERFANYKLQATNYK